MPKLGIRHLFETATGYQKVIQDTEKILKKTIETIILLEAGHDAVTFNDETGCPVYWCDGEPNAVTGVRVDLVLGLLMNTDCDENAPDGLLADGWFVPEDGAYNVAQLLECLENALLYKLKP